MLSYQNLLVILHILSARHDLACCEKGEELAREFNLLNKSLNGNARSIKARVVFGMSYNFELCLFLMQCNDHVALTLCFTLHPKYMTSQKVIKWHYTCNQVCLSSLRQWQCCLVLLTFHANIMSHNRMKSLSVFSYQIFDHFLEIKFSCVMIFKRLDSFELWFKFVVWTCIHHLVPWADIIRTPVKISAI